MNEKVIKTLKENMWDLATYGRELNVVPVAFKAVTEDGKLLVGAVFLKTTLDNIEENGQIAVSVWNSSTLEGYQIKGTAKYVTCGEVVDIFKPQVEAWSKGMATAKGALIITPQRVIVTTPGNENKEEL